MKTLLLLPALLLAAPAPGAAAEAAPTLRYVDTGDMRLEFSRSRDARGALVLVGRDTTTGRRFRFRVSPGGWVRGSVDGQRVVFHISEARLR